MKAPYIAKVTAEKLKNPAMPGGRNRQMIEIALSLLGNGFVPDAVFSQLRSMYASDGPDPVADEEIYNVIEWVIQRKPQPASRRSQDKRHTPPVSWKAATPVRASPENHLALVEKFLNGFCSTESEIKSLSKILLPDGISLWEQASFFLFHLFEPTDPINLVWGHRLVGNKAVPYGFGKTLYRSEWICQHFRFGNALVPQSEAGAWIRVNPTDGEGIADRNITQFRFTLLEFDNLPWDYQLSFFARLRLPIVAIVTSGGKSVHAWVRIDAPNLEIYKDRVSSVFRSLAPFGIDPANKNPSRLARLPGAKRTIGAIGDGYQRLIYLNPTPNNEGIHA